MEGPPGAGPQSIALAKTALLADPGRVLINVSFSPVTGARLDMDAPIRIP